MDYTKQFICAGTALNAYDSFVPSPYFRKTFFPAIGEGRLLISGLGFYRVWINGTEITKGLLAPYISNPDDIIYYDSYDLSKYLQPGEKNVLGFQLGNGMINAPGGEIWDFDKASCRGVPAAALCLEATDGEKTFEMEADETFRVHSSPVLFDEDGKTRFFAKRRRGKGAFAKRLPFCR